MSETLWTTEDISAAPVVLSPETAQSPTTSRKALYERFQALITPNLALDRSLVSFQANKEAPFSGWFKYREGFSERLVTHLLQELCPQPGILLDPFAGAGAALFAASTLGWRARGIELLPVGRSAMQARIAVAKVEPGTFQAAVERLAPVNFAQHYTEQYAFKHLEITRGAFPPEEERQLVGYLAYCHQHIPDKHICTLLLFAAFCVLEEISYTRKDGQYLRWDTRAGRRAGKKPFNKGRIVPFREALQSKLRQMAVDLGAAPTQSMFFQDARLPQEAHLPPDILAGSCLDVLPTLAAESVDCVLTSPPYANRYDYTRTYALELLYLGCDEIEVKRLRQAMLSCTVENKDKRPLLHQQYIALGREQDFKKIEATFQQQEALHEVLDILEAYRVAGKLNNENIARLVRNYFFEMNVAICELARLLKPGGLVIMVNDNVQYAGEEVPVDLILSNMAEAFGLKTRHIWTLGRGKGNSSQQMGQHGRNELRKCVYVWEKPAP